jgi:hypothetical protein
MMVATLTPAAPPRERNTSIRCAARPRAALSSAAAMPSIAGEGLADGRQGTSLAAIVRAAARQALASIRDPSVVFVFTAAGNPDRATPDATLVAAREAQALAPGAIVVATDAPGVLSMGAEREGQPAAAALCFDRSVARATLSTLALDLPRESHNDAIVTAAARVADGDRRNVGVVALLATASHTPESLTGIARHEGAPIVGAGAALVSGAAPGVAPTSCAAAIVTLSGSLRMTTVASPAVRVLTPWMRVTGQEGPFLLSLDDKPALDVLGDVVREGGRRDPLLVLIRGVEGEAALVRTIAGADPARGAVAIADVLPLGAEVAFGVRDAAAARGDLATRLAAVARASGGATPAAALMFTCAGRGKGLFGVGDVDAKALRSKFAAPAAGMQSAFELAPWGGVTRAHLYTAVSAIFHRPS